MIIRLERSVRVPGSNIILEKGERIRILNEEEKVLATSASLEGIKNLIKQYYYGSTMSYEENPDGSFSIYNSKGNLMKDVVIRKKGNRYRFIDINY